MNVFTVFLALAGSIASVSGTIIPVYEIADGQVQAPAASNIIPVSELPDGQVQAPPIPFSTMTVPVPSQFSPPPSMTTVTSVRTEIKTEIRTIALPGKPEQKQPADKPTTKRDQANKHTMIVYPLPKNTTTVTTTTDISTEFVTTTVPAPTHHHHPEHSSSPMGPRHTYNWIYHRNLSAPVAIVTKIIAVPPKHFNSSAPATIVTKIIAPPPQKKHFNSSAPVAIVTKIIATQPRFHNSSRTTTLLARTHEAQGQGQAQSPVQLDLQQDYAVQDAKPAGRTPVPGFISAASATTTGCGMLEAVAAIVSAAVAACMLQMGVGAF